jgi:hypothetical protein
MDRHSDPQYKTDDGNALRMWRDTAQNNFLSEQEGRPIFDEVIYVEVISPGSGNSTPIFELVRYMAKESGRAEPKYGNKYDEFKKYVKDFNDAESRDASLSGTPLNQWPEMTRTMVATLNAQKIFTVEALAVLPDSKLTVVGPDGRTWREKAAAYIEYAKNNAFATDLAAKLERQTVENEDLKAQIAALASQVDTLQAAQAAATGKPAKAPPAAPPVVQGELAPII